MTTGMMFFMTRPGCITPMEAIPTPLLAVPYAAPISENNHNKVGKSYQSLTIVERKEAIKFKVKNLNIID